MTIADYCNAMDRKEITINRDYQRSDKIWPAAAKSFLIESVLLGFPIPKIYLHSMTDLKTKKTIKEVVDGQQRSRAIHDYFHDKFALSGRLETNDVRGQRYSELDEDWQSRFVSYSLSIDLFIAASKNEVRQIFTRMNSYTVPLNPEEKRHAEYQGAFKWFIYNLSSQYSSMLRNYDVFSEKNLVRMQDMKLFTEVAHAIVHGVSTTNKTALDSIYKKFDVDECAFSDVESQIRMAFDAINSFGFLESSNLSKPNIIYALALAIVIGNKAIPNFEHQLIIDVANVDEVEERLAELSDALTLEGKELIESNWKAFVDATASRTNVKAQREARIRTFLCALSV